MTMPFAAFALRQWLISTGWDEHNAYSSLTRSSRAILDFGIEPGCRIDVGRCPTPCSANNAALVALSQSAFLNGSLAYFHSRPDLSLRSSQHPAALQLAAERFIVPPVPKQPEPLDSVWLRGERIDETSQLLYGRMYLPSTRLDALWALRLARSTQVLLSFISIPALLVPRPAAHSSLTTTGTADLQASVAASPAHQNLSISLQQDTGRWSSEYSYSLDDGMFGARFLHNFAGKSVPVHRTDEVSSSGESGAHADVEDLSLGSGLRGRFSAGAELFFSAQERSAGVSTGVRFCTVPDSRAPQPPTVITATFNPIMGHLSSAYAAKIGSDLALCSRFDFNFFSYESEVTLGAEMWQRHRAAAPAPPSPSAKRSRYEAGDTTTIPAGHYDADGDIIGLVKIRASTTTDVRFAWERKIRNCLVGFGISTDWSLRSPVRAMQRGDRVQRVPVAQTGSAAGDIKRRSVQPAQASVDTDDVLFVFDDAPSNVPSHLRWQGVASDDDLPSVTRHGDQSVAATRSPSPSVPNVAAAAPLRPRPPSPAAERSREPPLFVVDTDPALVPPSHAYVTDAEAPEASTSKSTLDPASAPSLEAPLEPGTRKAKKKKKKRKKAVADVAIPAPAETEANGVDDDSPMDIESLDEGDLEDYEGISVEVIGDLDIISEPAASEIPDAVGEGANEPPGLPDADELRELHVLQAAFGDDDDADKGRYWVRPQRDDIKCTRCHQPGHISRNCPNMVCFNCGALNDHELRECMMSKICNRCGLRGHLDRSCSYPRGSDAVSACPECPGYPHTQVSCAKRWRRYTLRSTPDPPASVKGYGRGHFCYNCAASGHLGDDCPLPRGHPLRPTDPTPFTLHPGGRANREAQSRSRRPLIVNGQRHHREGPFHAPRTQVNGRHDVRSMTISDSEDEDLLAGAKHRPMPPTGPRAAPRVRFTGPASRSHGAPHPHDHGDDDHWSPGQRRRPRSRSPPSAPTPSHSTYFDRDDPRPRKFARDAPGGSRDAIRWTPARSRDGPRGGPRYSGGYF